MPRYSSTGKNLSAMVHADRSKKCSLCGRMVYGNGGWTSHNRAHVKAGEAVELEKYYGGTQGTGRLFLAPDDEKVAEWEARGFVRRAHAQADVDQHQTSQEDK